MRKLLLIITSISISLLLISCDSFHKKYEYDSKPFLELLERDNVHKVTINFLTPKDKLDIIYEYAINDGDKIDNTIIKSCFILSVESVELYCNDKTLEPYDMDKEIHSDLTLYAKINYINTRSALSRRGVQLPSLPVDISYYEKNDDNVIFVSSAKDYYQYRVILNSPSLIVTSSGTGDFLSYDSKIITKEMLVDFYKKVFLTNVNIDNCIITSSIEVRFPLKYYKMPIRDYSDKELSELPDGSIKRFHSQATYSIYLFIHQNNTSNT